MDITNKISHAGTVCSRGLEAIEFLKNNNISSATFIHNDVTLRVYNNSNEHELEWQYMYRSLLRNKKCR